jgi:glyoxylase-like metal-dependent hydrolase (beta-lactamase superfamily II)/8-oxo-dGTP pyrophosphatase MutT (NUDIX family)
VQRNAAAILLVRGRGPTREVFLVERSPELRFFGGYWALPGGVRSPGDGDDVGGDDNAALRRTAVRELFEETGVLLDPAASTTPKELRDSVRTAMLAEGDDPQEAARAWSSLCGQHRGDRCVRDLCRILTPSFVPTRYDTLFVSAELPPGEVPEVWPGELLGGRFWQPAAALSAWRQGELLLVPPVLIMLEHLVASADFAAFGHAMAHTAATYRQGALHRVRFSPGVLLASLKTPTLPPATTTNCYIVGRDELWVVDPATPEPGEQQRLFALLDELRAEGARLSGILVTHHHIDHVGAVAATSQRYDLVVRAHPRTLARLPQGFVRGVPMLDGERIALGRAPDDSDGWFLAAVFTPGHDQGHLCFAESRYGAVLVGDMLSTISTIVIDPPEGHLRTYLQSLERLLALPMRTLYPAHGPAVQDGHKVVRQYLRHRAQREQKLLAALAEQPATARELLPKVYWDVDKKMLGIAARSLQAGLDKLAEDGLVAAEGGVWRLL